MFYLSRCTQLDFPCFFPGFLTIFIWLSSDKKNSCSKILCNFIWKFYFIFISGMIVRKIYQHGQSPPGPVQLTPQASLAWTVPTHAIPINDNSHLWHFHPRQILPEKLQLGVVQVKVVQLRVKNYGAPLKGAHKAPHNFFFVPIFFYFFKTMGHRYFALFFHLFSDLFFVFDQIFQLYLQPNLHSCFFINIDCLCWKAYFSCNLSLF